MKRAAPLHLAEFCYTQQKAMCRQPLATGGSRERKFALSCLPNRAHVSVRILHDFLRVRCRSKSGSLVHGAHVTVRVLRIFPRFCSRSISGSLLHRRISDGASSFLGKGRQPALEAEHYCRKHDLSTASLMRWARHLQSAEDLNKHAWIYRNCVGKSRNGRRRTSSRTSPRGLGTIAMPCVRTAVR